MALGESVPIYIVGGPVRDALLGTSPRDLDFVVVGDALGVAHRIARKLEGRVVVHPKFGTATIEFASSRVDVVTARQEVYPRPGALPEVTPGTIFDDLARRDFSINALALPLHDQEPSVLDSQHGIEDIEKGLIRILHHDSFVDDPTRAFRAVRYEQRLDFAIEDVTLSCLHHAVQGGCIASVSGHRLRRELELILYEDQPWRSLSRLWELGILKAVHPSLANFGIPKALATLAAPKETAFDVGPLQYIGALAYGLTEMEGEAVAMRLNMPIPWTRVVRDTISLRQLEATLADPQIAPSEVYRLLEPMSLAAVMALSRIARSATAAQRVSEYYRDLRHVSVALNGRDLLDMGVPDGPMIGAVLQELKDGRLDGRIVSMEDERRWVRERTSAIGGDAGHE